MPEPTTIPASPSARLEAFSDGVFAIAITLLVLEIRLPPEEAVAAAGGLGSSLLHLWPSYVGYVISFLTIGIMWANHHGVMRLIAKVDHGLIVWNLLLLMLISFTPFSTAVMAEYLPHAGRDRSVAVAFYCLTFTITAVLYNFFWRHAARRRRLIAAHVTDARVAAVTHAYWPGPVVYATATALSFASVAASLLVVAAVDVFFILPRRGAHAEDQAG